MATSANASRQKAAATQDSWQPPARPAGFEDLKIKVYNSLTRTKVRQAKERRRQAAGADRQLIRASSGRLRDREAWRSHLVQLRSYRIRCFSHGTRQVRSRSEATKGALADSATPLRNYMTQDIMRRILRDYFGYEVNFVMNITDVDDKVRSRTTARWPA